MKVVKLKEVCSKITDGSHNPPAGRAEGLPMLSSRNITTDGLVLNDSRFISEEEFESENKRTNVSSGDVLMTIVGTIGRVLVLNNTHPKFTLQRSVCVLKPNQQIIYSTFLGYCLKSDNLQRELQQRAKGVAQKGIYLNDIRDLNIPLPPLKTQKKIAEILDQADALRKKTQQIIDNYDELAQSIFLDMFGDPVTNPKGWEKVQLGEIVINKDSRRIPVKLADRDSLEGEYPYYGASGIIDYVDNFLFNGENLLIGEDGANLLARNSPIAFIARGKYWVNNHAHVLGYKGTARLVFLEYLINSIDLTPYITGSAQPKLTRKKLDLIKVIHPSLQNQNDFANRISNIEQQKELAKQSLKQSEDLFNALLQKAFKGELVNSE